MEPRRNARSRSCAGVEGRDGNVLQDGDTVVLVKDLRSRASSSAIKVGTKVKNIRLIDGDHDIDCKMTALAPCNSRPSS